MKQEYNWARFLAYVTGLVNHELLLQNQYLAAENRILRSHLPSRLRLSNPERTTLGEIGLSGTRFRIRRSAMFCGGMSSLRHPNRAGRRRLRTSSGRT